MFDAGYLLGQVLDGKYRLEEKLGEGGMGAVYRATHLGTDRVVALKLIAPGLMDQVEFVARFQREARATGRLRHPNIVDLTDFGFAAVEGRELAYLVMEFLEGEPLSKLLKRNPAPPLAFVVELVQQVCSALQEAHEQGIVHRDLKPDNLWLEPNRRGGQTVKILDFGLAKIYDPKSRSEGAPERSEEDTETLAMGAGMLTPATGPGSDGMGTEVGTVLGTPAYMSPEQCRGIALGPRSDLYSLGVIVYQMLSGRTPFQGGSLELINAHIQSDVPDLRELRPDLPPGVAELVMECLAKDPRKRPENAEILGNALEAYAEEMGTTFKKGLGLYLDLFPSQRAGILKPFLLPFGIALALLAYGWVLDGRMYRPEEVTEVGRGRIMVLAFIDALAYWGALASLWFGAMVHAHLSLAGSGAPRVLRRLLQPLAAEDAVSVAQDRLRFKAYRRFTRLYALAPTVALALICLDFGWSIRWIVTHPGLNSTNDMIAILGLVLACLLPAALIYATYRMKGSTFGNEYGLACVMFMEGESIQTGGRRFRQLHDAVRRSIPSERWEWGWKPSRYARRRKQVSSGPGTTFSALLGMSVGVAAFVGLKIWDRFLPPDSSFSGLSFAAWWVLWCTLLLAFLGPLNGILAAQSYLRLRKIARESMTKALKDFEARMAQPRNSP